VTPDHTIRTKNWPLVLERAARRRGIRGEHHRGGSRFHGKHRATSHATMRDAAAFKTMLDPLPRVVLVPGLGLFGLGRSKKEARIAADLAEAAVRNHHRRRNRRPVSNRSRKPICFDCEYWSLEQAKLGAAKELPLAGQRGDHRRRGRDRRCHREGVRGCRRRGALLDVNEAAARSVAQASGGAALAVRCDVTDAASVQAGFDKVVENFGGVDIVVSNAGAAGRAASARSTRRSCTRVSISTSTAISASPRPRCGSCGRRAPAAALLFNTSKQAINPGPNFGPYGLPKAATFFWRANMPSTTAPTASAPNPSTRPHPLGPAQHAMIAERAQGARPYRDRIHERNLLRREVTAEDVAQAFLAQALALKTTPTSPPSTAATSRPR